MDLIITMWPIICTITKATACVGFVVIGTLVLDGSVVEAVEPVVEVLPNAVWESYDVSGKFFDTVIYYTREAMYPTIDPELAKFRDRNWAGVIGSWIPFYEWVYPTVPREVYEQRIWPPHAYMEYWVPFREWTYPYFPPEVHEYRCRTWIGWAKTLVPFAHKLFTW